MPRRIKNKTQGEGSQEKVVKRKKQEAPAENVAVKRRGRPKKAEAAIIKAKQVIQKIEAPIEEIEQFDKVEEFVQEPKKIVLRHFTEEEIAAEAKRTRVMWASVIFVAVIVLFVWVANLKKIVGVDAAGANKLISLEEFTKGFKQNFKQINSSISTLKDEVASSSKNEATSATTSENYDTNIDVINKELKEMIINASSTINNK